MNNKARIWDIGLKLKQSQYFVSEFTPLGSPAHTINSFTVGVDASGAFRTNCKAQVHGWQYLEKLNLHSGRSRRPPRELCIGRSVQLSFALYIYIYELGLLQCTCCNVYRLDARLYIYLFSFATENQRYLLPLSSFNIYNICICI